MEQTPKAHVSRSGRVCKKSSKLMDFQSPDEIGESKQQKKSGKLKHLLQTGPGGDAIKSDQDSDDMDGPSDSGDEANDSNTDSEDDDDAMDIEDMEGMPMDEEEDDKSDSELLTEVAPKRSLYMSEKSSKYKKMLKDGKVVVGKTQRKDKGKRRFTAYMLWAKEARKQMLTNPDLDFGTISKRLGEMWANVPSNQKYNWKRRAKRIANKFKQSDEKALEAPFVKRYLHLDKQQRSSEKGSSGGGTFASTANNPLPGVGGGGEKSTPRGKKGTQQKANMISTSTEATKATSNTNQKPQQQHQSPESPSKSSSSHHLKLPGCAPTDVAAHLKLLGDSLTIIGERLKEHEGQIAVSGSLSVLLDSLLCSIGPLMCLTIQIPCLQEQADELKDLFQNTLDNIAYVMPGL